MKERPILFSAPMVRAILEGRKSVTRRVVKCRAPVWEINDLHESRDWPWFEDADGDWHSLPCPYGAIGDRLWVRETWGYDWYDDDQTRAWKRVVYRADDPQSQPQDQGDPVPWKPSIHMPRALSRITLEITDVRVERLNDISDGDGIAEGYASRADFLAADWARSVGYANPWVWVLTFWRVA